MPKGIGPKRCNNKYGHKVGTQIKIVNNMRSTNGCMKSNEIILIMQYNLTTREIRIFILNNTQCFEILLKSKSSYITLQTVKIFVT